MDKILPPKTINDKWAFDKPFRKGGQANTFLYRSKTSDKKAVLKILKDDATEYQKERLRREIETLLKIDHPNIVKILDYDKAKNPKWFLMPFGDDFKIIWNDFKKTKINDKNLIFSESLMIVRGLLSGLQQLHQKAYIHRDIKPSNIIISGERNPVLIDLGIVAHDKFEPITSAKGAGNTFVLISKLVSQTKFIDCLSIASLWVWLLANDPSISYGHYHWKYVDLLGDDINYEYVRATLAICSHEITAPKDAGQMLEIIDSNLKLLGEREPMNISDIEIQKAFESQTEIETKENLRLSETRERIEAAISIAKNPLEILRKNLSGFLLELQHRGLKLSFDDFYQFWQINNQSTNPYLDFSQYFLKYQPSEDLRFFNINISPNVRQKIYFQFLIAFDLSNHSDDELGFVCTWKHHSETINKNGKGKGSASGTSKYAITKTAKFKTVSNDHKPIYTAEEMAEKFLDAVIGYFKSLPANY